MSAVAPRRILFVTHAYPRAAGDAAGSFLHRLAIALTAAGHEVRVLAPAGPGLPAESRHEGIEVRRYRYAAAEHETLAYTGTMAAQAFGSMRGFLALIGLVRHGARAVRAEVAAWRPDVVHAHWWFPAALQVRLARVPTPVVVTLHGSDVRLAQRVPGAAAIARRVLDAATVTTVSAWLRDRCPVDGARIAPMPVDATVFTPDATVRVPGRVVFAGRLNAQKGIRPLLEAFARLPGTCTLEVIGDGPERASATALARRLGIADRVRWGGAGTTADLATAFRRAHVVAVPSVAEGLGLVAVEAQLCGAPVVGFRSGGLPDVVCAPPGRLVEPTVDGLVHGLTAVLASPPATRPTAEMDALRDRFAPAAVAVGYGTLYEEACRVA